MIAILELPTTTDMAAPAFAISGSGFIRKRTTQLITADAALKKTVDYRKPGR